MMIRAIRVDPPNDVIIARNQAKLEQAWAVLMGQYGWSNHRNNPNNPNNSNPSPHTNAVNHPKLKKGSTQCDDVILFKVSRFKGPAAC